MLSAAQIEQFRTQGFVVAEAAVPAATVAALNTVLAGWVEESRGHTANWDRMLNGKMRFDLEPGHSAEAPKLRRVGSPCDASDVYRDYLFEGPAADLVAQLVGPDVRFHHCKLNIKFPGMAAKVDWHQDLPFEPHTNRDLVTTLLLLDDMNEENGCLRVVPGSHDTWLSHYSGERFTGATDAALAEGFMRASVPIAGRAWLRAEFFRAAAPVVHRRDDRGGCAAVEAAGHSVRSFRRHSARQGGAAGAADTGRD